MRTRMCVTSKVVTLVAWLAMVFVIVSPLACASPTLPLPPPAIPNVTASSTPGYVHLVSQGGAEPNAIIVIVNQNPTVPNDKRVSGTQADGAGSWDAEVPATHGDVLSIYETSGTEASPSITVQVP